MPDLTAAQPAVAAPVRIDRVTPAYWRVTLDNPPINSSTRR